MYICSPHFSMKIKGFFVIGINIQLSICSCYIRFPFITCLGQVSYSWEISATFYSEVTLFSIGKIFIK